MPAFPAVCVCEKDPNGLWTNIDEFVQLLNFTLSADGKVVMSESPSCPPPPRSHPSCLTLPAENSALVSLPALTQEVCLNVVLVIQVLGLFRTRTRDTFPSIGEDFQGLFSPRRCSHLALLPVLVMGIMAKVRAFSVDVH